MSAINMINEVSQKSVDNALALVSSIDLSKISAKLQSHYGVSVDDVEVMSDLYRKWLALHMCYPNAELAPNDMIDKYWHAHILDTIAYSRDCEKLFGYYLHHYPYFGLEGDADNLKNAFDLSNMLYVRHFGHNLKDAAHPCKPKGCR